MLLELDGAQHSASNPTASVSDSELDAVTMLADKPLETPKEWHEKAVGKIFIPVISGSMLLLVGIFFKRYAGF